MHQERAIGEQADMTWEVPHASSCGLHGGCLEVNLWMLAEGYGLSRLGALSMLCQQHALKSSPAWSHAIKLCMLLFDASYRG